MLVILIIGFTDRTGGFFWPCKDHPRCSPVTAALARVGPLPPPGCLPQCMFILLRIVPGATPGGSLMMRRTAGHDMAKQHRAQRRETPRPAGDDVVSPPTAPPGQYRQNAAGSSPDSGLGQAGRRRRRIPVGGAFMIPGISRNWRRTSTNTAPPHGPPGSCPSHRTGTAAGRR